MTKKRNHMELRTKPSIKDGIKVVYKESSTIELIDYQPGNGSRYLVLFSHINDKFATKKFGFDNSITCVVTLLNTSRSITINKGQRELLPLELLRKVSDNPSDAYVVGEFIAHHLDLRFTGSYM